jgi:hypothetical protein
MSPASGRSSASLTRMRRPRRQDSRRIGWDRRQCGSVRSSPAPEVLQDSSDFHSVDRERAPAIAVLAFKAKPLRGRFASLDRSARRWPLASKSPCRADPAQSPRSGRSAAEERRSRLTATGRRGPLHLRAWHTTGRTIQVDN